MFLFLAIEIIIFLLIVAILVYSYSKKEVPFYVKFFVFLTWSLCFCIVIILPLDIYYVKKTIF